MEWHAVRCIFRHWAAGSEDQTYEERVTLWHAESGPHAIELAEQEAADYCDVLDSEGGHSEYVGLAQSYRLDDTPEHGAEVFSMMRDSTLDSDAYIARFFSDGSERIQDLDWN